MNFTGKQLVEVGFFCLIVAFALTERLSPLVDYSAFPGNYIAGEEPVLTNIDGYYYLLKAEEWQNGSARQVKRAIPDGLEEKKTPLLSICIATLAKVTGMSLNRAGLYLPVFFSLAFTLPLFLLGFAWGKNTTALIATAVTLLAPSYVSRNCYGFLDTDCLNSFFPVMAVYLAVGLVRAEEKKRLGLFYALCLLNYTLFLLWWNNSPVPPTLLALLPALLALGLRRQAQKQTTAATLVAATGMVLPLLVVNGTETLTLFVTSSVDLFKLFVSGAEQLFPNPGIMVGELSPISILELSGHIFFIKWLILCSLLGLTLLCYHHFREAVLLLPLLVTGCCTFLLGRRFEIFFTPVAGLGFAFFCYQALIFICRFLHRRWQTTTAHTVLYAAVALLCGSQFSRFAGIPPVFNAPVIEGMQQLRTQTEPDAVVWNFWGAGYPIMYWGQRDTINDGGVFSLPIRTWATAVPLAAGSDRFAANFINFYISAGTDGLHGYFEQMQAAELPGWQLLQQALSQGPESIDTVYAALPKRERDLLQKKIFPAPARPVYLFLEKRMATFSTYPCWFGQWDPDTRHSNRYLVRFNLTLPPGALRASADSPLPQRARLSIDPATGVMTAPAALKEPVQLAEIYTTDEKKSVRHIPGKGQKKTVTPHYAFTYTTKPFLIKESGRYVADIIPEFHRVLIRDKQMADSLVHRLFWRKNSHDPRYFTPVKSQNGVYQIWRVSSDMSPAPEEKTP